MKSAQWVLLEIIHLLNITYLTDRQNLKSIKQLSRYLRFLTHNSTNKPFPKWHLTEWWPEQYWENSFPENLIIMFTEMQKKQTCSVFYNFGPYDLLLIKNACGDSLFFVKVTRWSAASLKLTLYSKWCKLSQIQIKAHFQLALVSFSQVSWKLEYFQTFSFHRRGKHR